MRKNLCRLLPAVAAMILGAACTQLQQQETPEEPEVKGTVIYYTATVNDSKATRATLSGDKKYLFQEGDVLQVTGTGISGELELTEGAGEASATFTGTLLYTGVGEKPADDLELNAVLVSTRNAMTTLTYDTAEYPSTAIASTLAEAVEKYSCFRGTSYYADKSFTVSQQTSFLNFTVTLADGTAADTNLSVILRNGGETVRTGTVTTVSDGGVKAKFVAAMPKGTTMSSATVQVGGRPALSFGGTTVLAANKIYNISKSISNPLTSVRKSDIGKVIGADGKIYATATAAKAAGTTACAVIAYVGSETCDAAYTHGLAVAMRDAKSGAAACWKNDTGYENGSGRQYSNLDDAIAANESGRAYSAGRTAQVTWPAFYHALNNTITEDAENGISKAAPEYFTSGWFLPSMAQWNRIIQGLTDRTYTVSSSATASWNEYYKSSVVSTKIVSAGGDAFKSARTSPTYGHYWSSSEYSDASAWMMDFYEGRAVGIGKRYDYGYVRAVLAF